MQAGDDIVKVAAGPGGDDRRRGRRAALPARTRSRDDDAPRAAGRRAEPGLAGVVPRPPRRPARPPGNAGWPPRARRRRPGRASGRCVVDASCQRPRRSRRSTAPTRTARPLPAALPGQFVDRLRLRARPSRRPVRSYSLSGPPRRRGYRISVKREADGSVSGYMHTQGPRRRHGGRSPRRAGRSSSRPATSRCCCVSAGIGVTPVLAMLHALARREPPARSGGCTARATGRAAVRRRGPARCSPGCRNARRIVCYSRPVAADAPGATTTGRHWPRSLRLGVPPDARRTCAGRPRSCDDVTAALTDRGCRGRPHPHRAVRRRQRSPPASPPTHRPPAASTRRAGGQRAGGHLRPQRPHRRLGPRLRQPAGHGRGLRRPGPVVLPDRRLPHLRDRRAGAVRSCYDPDPVDAPAPGDGADLLRTPGRRRRARPVASPHYGSY